MSGWYHDHSQPNTYWKHLIDLPLEKGLVLGGAASLAFAEVIGVLNSFLQNNLHKTLDILIPRPKRSGDKYIVHAVAEELNLSLDQKRTKCIPLIAREKIGVGGIILSTNGIYYLKPGTMQIFSSTPFDDGLEKRDDITISEEQFQLHALCQLSPHTFQLYNAARNNPPSFFCNVKQRFNMFLFDCLLQMILSDLFTLIHGMEIVEDLAILKLASNLISRITRSKDKEDQKPPPPKSWYEFIFKRGLFINKSSRVEKKVSIKNNHNSSSEKILKSWARENRSSILANFKHSVGSITDEATHLFCKNDNVKSKVRGEKTFSWEQGASLTHCIWEVKIDGLFKTGIQFFDPKPIKESNGTWKYIAKLRYSFIDRAIDA
jgi:hypothetical protein